MIMIEIDSHSTKSIGHSFSTMSTVCTFSHTQTLSSTKSSAFFSSYACCLVGLLAFLALNNPLQIWLVLRCCHLKQFFHMSVRTDQCFDYMCFRGENTDLQTYVDPNTDSILSVAHLTLGYFSIGTLFQNSMVPSLKPGFSWSSSHRSIISTSGAASSVISGGFKQSISSLKGSTRKIICGLFSCRSQNWVTKLSCRFSPSVAYLSVCLFRAVLVTCPLAFSRLGNCAKSPFEHESWTASVSWQLQTHFAAGQAAF